MSTGQNTGHDTGFSVFGLQAELLRALDASGYTEPSPIQSAAIPHLLAGKDVLGLAQTGTGKTAAFALPLIQQWQPQCNHPQALILTPTRELALQVAEAFTRYARYLKGLKVTAIYGGQDMRAQLRTLHQGVHVVVGTPGRIMDHLRRGSLDTSAISKVVLDEADEMLRMGFIDDVQWILEQIPAPRQTALFSATMPDAIRRIADRYLHTPEVVRFAGTNRTAEQVEQFVCQIPRGCTKFDALTRILETNPVDAAIIFVRTRGATVSLAEQLEQQGYRAAAINGDMNQNQREQSIQALKQGRLDLLVATDVAARGIDVSRITHVINYDVPHDQEAYVHRIGRTGRAGRTGQAIMFISGRERHLLRAIERATRQTLQPMQLPSAQALSQHRRQAFIERVADDISQANDLDFYRKVVKDICQRHQLSPEEAAAVMVFRLQQQRPLQLKHDSFSQQAERTAYAAEAEGNPTRGKNQKRGKPGRKPVTDLIRYRVEVGRDHEVRPGDLVGAIANEAGIHPNYIGAIQIKQQHSFIDMPADIPADMFQHLSKVWVRNRPLRISVVDDNHTNGQRDKNHFANNHNNQFKNGKAKAHHRAPRQSTQQRGGNHAAKAR